VGANVISAVVITVSNRAAAGVYTDAAGPAVAELLAESGFDVAPVVVIPDGRKGVASAVVDACERARVVVTSGGTGLHPGDETPEGTADVLDYLVPGIAEAMRAASLAVTPMAALSRGIAGVRGGSLVVNLPGSPKGAVENLLAVLPVLTHAIEQLDGGDHPR
jgi:molybdopterin adenylyltransferase